MKETMSMKRPEDIPGLDEAIQVGRISDWCPGKPTTTGSVMLARQLRDTALPVEARDL